MSFNEINFTKIEKNPTRLFNEDWALLTAGNEEKWNTMTVSWGAFGELWGKAVAFVFVRPQRYTKEFIDSQERFTLTFFGGKNKIQLSKCGTVSGRDHDKAAECRFTPFFVDGTTAIEQGEMIIVCKKLARLSQFSPEAFIDADIEKWYAEKDYHYTYIAEIEKVLVK